MAKKQEKDKACGPGKPPCCVGIMAILIIILTWLPSMASTWSKIVVTIAAAMILLGSGMSKMNK